MNTNQRDVYFKEEVDAEIDYFGEPPMLNAIRRKDSLESLSLENIFAEELLSRQVQPGTFKNDKTDKPRKIRTNRNSQKVYHTILKQWLVKNECSAISSKYSEYFNQRVYFILVLDEILKQIDGEQFLQSYEELARSVVSKKIKKIEAIEKETSDFERSQHLKRVIEEVEFSIKACREFISGNVYDALLIVYKRNQSKIIKCKEFERALKVYHQVTGHQLMNY